MYYPQDIIDRVRDASDIVDIISSYVKLTKKGSNYFGLCPFHNEKTGSFCVNPAKQMYYCFGCGAGGNVISFVMQYENYTFAEALKYLADRANISLPQQSSSSEDKKNKDIITKLLDINKEAGIYYYKMLISNKGKKGYDYLKNRKLSDETIRHFGLGYADMASSDLYKHLKDMGYTDDILKESGLVTIEEKGARDKFWNRAMFPILDINNKVIGFGGRVMGDGEPKYLNSPETKIFDKSRNLYGLNFARKSRKDYFLVCEGYMDVISMHQAGFVNSVASLGTALTNQHANLLKRYVKKVILTYDSDDAGIKAARRAIPIMREAGINCKVLDMKPYKDPDEFIKALGKDEFEKRIDNAKNAFLWDIEMTKKDYDMKDPDSQTAFIKECANKLTIFTDKIERDNYTRALASEQMIPYEDLKDMVDNIGRSTSTGITSIRYERNNRKNNDISSIRYQREIIAGLYENDDIRESIKSYISLDDLTDPILQKIAAIAWEAKDGQCPNPSTLPDIYHDDTDALMQISKIFGQSSQMREEDIKKSVSESIIKLKLDNLEAKRKSTDDIEEIQQIIYEQARLKKTKINI